MCPVVFYELWRGLSYRGADRQLEELNAFAGTLQWVDYDRAMWVEAAGLWADRRRHGRTHDDADLLIAAFARRLRATLVTNNMPTSRTSMSRSSTGQPISRAVEVPAASYGTGRGLERMVTLASPGIHHYAFCGSIPAHFRIRRRDARVPEIRCRESIRWIQLSVAGRTRWAAAGGTGAITKTP